MKRTIFLFPMILLLGIKPLYAHKENCSFTFLELHGKQLKYAVAFSSLDMARIWRLDLDGDGILNQAEIKPVLPVLEELLLSHSSLSADHAPVELNKSKPFVTEAHLAGAKYIQLHYEVELSKLAREIVVKNSFHEWMGPQHKNFTRLTAGKKKQYAVFTSQYDQVRFTPGGTLSMWQRLKIFLWLGMEHIFIGYDHILFLVALIAIGGKMGEMIKLVTAFTVAHSITLALASFKILSLQPNLIEALIALSIVYVAIENFFIHSARYRWILTFFFGLIHGFGFANVLQDLGLPPEGFAGALFSFNLGVEIGQVLILLVLFPLLLWVSRKAYTLPFKYVVSSIVLSLGWAWFLERTLGWALLPF